MRGREKVYEMQRKQLEIEVIQCQLLVRVLGESSVVLGINECQLSLSLFLSLFFSLT